MKTLKELLIPAVLMRVEEYNICSRLNSFFYKDDKAHQYLKKSGMSDRTNLIMRCHVIKSELIAWVHHVFHNQRCQVVVGGKTIEGVIKHELTRVYTDSKGQPQNTTNDVSFRREYEDATYSAPENIALWVDTGDKYTTHLYNATQIMFNDDFVVKQM